MTRCEWQGLPDALVPHCRAAHAPLELQLDSREGSSVSDHSGEARDATVPFLVDRGASALDGVPTIVHHEQRLFSLTSAGPGQATLLPLSKVRQL